MAHWTKGALTAVLVVTGISLTSGEAGAQGAPPKALAVLSDEGEAAEAACEGDDGTTAESQRPDLWLTPTLGLFGAPKSCKPGARVPCQCPNGSWSEQTCESSGVHFSLCACASVSVKVPTVKVPTVKVQTVDVPNVDVTIRKPRRKPGRRVSGLGMLIGGGTSLLLGTGSLVWGIERLRETRNDPFGIVLIATGGTAMGVGLPLTIVGIAFLASRGLHPDQNASSWQVVPTADGLAVTF